MVTVIGPRQSGKTTLCKSAFPSHRYVSLESLDMRAYAQEDPRGFLADYGDGAIIGEVQRVPALLSYIQTEVDERAQPGRFILTGSQNFSLSAAISQSLAGRTAVLTLLPPSLAELRQFGAHVGQELMETLWAGAYPRIFDRHIPPDRWLADYITTYVERDVRAVLHVTDLAAFTTFVRLAAGRTATEVNLSAMAADAGITHNTAKAWLSVLEAGFLCTTLPAYHGNVRKQLVKRGKLHFFDTGLVCHLLGITSPAQLRYHPQRGQIFESWVVAEIIKTRYNAGKQAFLQHFRQSRGLEVDAVLRRGDRTILVEMKSGMTVRSEHFKAMGSVKELLMRDRTISETQAVLVHGGDSHQDRSAGLVLPWAKVGRGPWL